MDNPNLFRVDVDGEKHTVTLWLGRDSHGFCLFEVEPDWDAETKTWMTDMGFLEFKPCDWKDSLEVGQCVAVNLFINSPS
jgi:hypothetical protein